MSAIKEKWLCAGNIFSTLEEAEKFRGKESFPIRQYVEATHFQAALDEIVKLKKELHYLKEQGGRPYKEDQ